eukprot:Nk52_evm9s16 gene=Nk52_evmTU9s16
MKNGLVQDEEVKRRAVSKDPLPVFVGDLHSEALECWHYCLRKGILCFNDIHVVHYDSHPDLSFQHDLLADVIVDDPQELRSRVDIGEFIIPMIYAGHVGAMTWVKPSWARQFTVLREGNLWRRFMIGKERESGCIRVTSDEHYFVDDLLTIAPLDTDKVNESDSRLLNAKAFSLGVWETALDDTDMKNWYVQMKRDKALCNFIGKKNQLILDIDLDYFATANPSVMEFCNIYGHEHLGLLRDIFWPGERINLSCFGYKEDAENLEGERELKGLTGITKKQNMNSSMGVEAKLKQREVLMKSLEGFFEDKLYNDDFEEVYGKLKSCLVEIVYHTKFSKEKTKTLLAEFHTFVKNASAKLSKRGVLSVQEGLDCILEAGFMLPQPHAIPSQSLITKHIQGPFKASLESLRMESGFPSVVTIAKSQLDGYCPEGLVADILSEVCIVLEDVFESIDIKTIP